MSAEQIALVGITELLRGVPRQWNQLGVSVDDLLDTCATQELTCLAFEQLSRFSNDWPRSLSESLARAARIEMAMELLRRDEVIAVLDALAAHGIRPILTKGTGLAYSVYSRPSSRPRADTDLIVPRDQTDAARAAMESLGYSAPNVCDGEFLFCQFQMAKGDRFGVDHVFDFHWKISTQSVFRNVLTYEEFAEESVALPALGAHACVPAPVHALLLACIHPVMHHRNSQWLIWTYDVHLIASALSERELDRFADLACTKGVAAVTAHQLGQAKERFGTPGLERVIERLMSRRGNEPSMAYLGPDRQWRHELAANVRALPRWRDRFTLLREVMLPSREYILNAYGFTESRAGTALLPLLYCHRLLHGTWKMAAGRK